MSDIKDSKLDLPEERSALETHIFGLGEGSSGPVSDSPSSSDKTPPENMGRKSIPNDDATDAVVKPAAPIVDEVSALLRDAIEFHENEKFQEAEVSYKKLLALRPNISTAWINLGVLLRRRHMTESAVICMRRGLALHSKDGPSWSNLGNALRDLGRYEESIRAHRHAIELDPGAAQIHYNLGLVHRDLGHLEDAEDCFRRAELLGYAEADLRWDHALLHLLKGNLVEGFEGFEARWRSHNSKPVFPELPIWKGADLEGQVLVIFAEHGLGDTLQFSRFIPQIIGRAETIIFYCQASVARLMRSSPYLNGITIIGDNEELPEDIDAVLPLLSLPRLLGTSAETIPTTLPYLEAPVDDVPLVNKGGHNILRVGLVWAGENTHKNDHNRSVIIHQLSQILDLPGIQFYSLQKGGHEKDIVEYALDPMIRDLSPHINDFADTASLMKNLDLVISVDTAAAHLAGALNIPTFVMLPFAPDWRWQMVRDDSPWYPSMTLIRQTSPGDWREVFHRIRNKLIVMLHENADKDNAEE